MERICVKVRGEDMDVLRWAEQFGEAKLVKNAVLIYPRMDALIPSLLKELDGKKITLLVEAHEKGGGATNTGYATVVCSPVGYPIKPVRILRPRAGGEHALFSSPSLVTVLADRSRNETKVRIKKFLATTDGLKEETIWEGYPEDLPNRYKDFAQAVEAAVRKADCYHCRHVHFMREENNEAD